MNLIGKKINLKQESIKIGNDSYTKYSLNDPLIEEEIRNSIGGEVRIFVPGTFGTTDYKKFRTNIYVDKDGIVTKVTQG